MSSIISTVQLPRRRGRSQPLLVAVDRFLPPAVRAAENTLDGGGAFGLGARFSIGYGIVDLVANLLFQVLQVLVGHHPAPQQSQLEARNGIVLGLSLQHLAWDVLGRVVRRVARHPKGLA